MFIKYDYPALFAYPFSASATTPGIACEATSPGGSRLASLFYGHRCYVRSDALRDSHVYEAYLQFRLLLSRISPRRVCSMR